MVNKKIDPHPPKTTKRRKRTRLAKGQELEVRHVTETTDLSPKQAEALLQRHGNDWGRIREEVEKLKD